MHHPQAGIEHSLGIELVELVLGLVVALFTLLYDITVNIKLYGLQFFKLFSLVMTDDY